VLPVLVTSRSYDEYVAMFDLSAAELAGSVLDCCAGAAGFVAAARGRGCRAVACDPAYATTREDLAASARADLETGAAIAFEHSDRFTWQWYGRPERRQELRLHALTDFLADLLAHPDRYVAAALPQLPFVDAAFDLAVCSHLLFTWADELDRSWHLAALRELCRVGREVRVFPTVVQGRGEPVPFWTELMADLVDAGLRTQTRPVPYEFQVGADTMLVVTSA
jgi:SAM-dependent methyltransferase